MFRLEMESSRVHRLLFEGNMRSNLLTVRDTHLKNSWLSSYLRDTPTLLCLGSQIHQRMEEKPTVIHRSCIAAAQFVQFIIVSYHNGNAKHVLHSSLSIWWDSIVCTFLETLHIKRTNLFNRCTIQCKTLKAVDASMHSFFTTRQPTFF